MFKYVIDRTKKTPITFVGRELAHVSSKGAALAKGHRRWTELKAYQTRGGTWVGHTIGRSNVVDEHDIIDAEAFKSGRELAAWMGNSWLSKELFEKLDIDLAEVIE